MAGAAGVAGVVDPLGEVVDAPQARGELPHPLLPQLGAFVQKDHVVLRPLIAVHVAIAGAVAELQRGAVGKGEGAGGGLVLGDVVQLGPQLADMVALQLLIGAPDDQQPDAGIVQRQQLGLGADGPAFAAAPRPAEGNVFFLALQKQPLLFIGVGNGQCDRGIGHGSASLQKFSTGFPQSFPHFCGNGCTVGEKEGVC